jgi:hypothetical protein
VQYVPFSVIKSIHEQTHSAMPDAPVRPHVPRRPRRHPLRAVRRLVQRPRPVIEATPPALTLLTSELSVDQLCEAEVRDRGTTPAGVARAC